MRMLASLCVIASLAGCAAASPTILANGKKGLSIDCSGEAISWEQCYDKAAATCPSGDYKIVGTDGTPAPARDDKTLGADLGNYKNRNLVVQCR